MIRRLLLAALCLGRAGVSHAQSAGSTGPIEPDRPDFTDGVTTVAPRHLQIESGYSYVASGSRGAGMHSFPELLVRVGVLDAVELRVSDNYLIQDRSGSNRAGFDDITLGAKLRVLPQRSARPAVSTEVAMTAPTGQTAITGNGSRFLPSVALLLGWGGDGAWSAGMEASGQSNPDGTGTGVASLSIQFQPAHRWQFYAEAYQVIPLGTAGGPEWYQDSGVHLFLTDNFQLDARFGVGLGSPSNRYSIGAGLAVRH